MADTKKGQTTTKTTNNNTATVNMATQVSGNALKQLENSTDGSMRLFGIPHQFIDINDPRLGTKSNLGRCFAERIIMEAPVVCLKPGLPDFLPGQSKEKKAAFVNGIMQSVNNSDGLKSIFSNMNLDDSNDALLYYSIKDSYNEMMAKVNVMCKLMAVFLGIADTKVPWASSGVTFGRYDWRYYSFKNVYNDSSFKVSGEKSSIGAFLKDTIMSASSTLMKDTQWLRFYVDSNSSFGESASNSTTSSVLESFTEKLEGVAKELDSISGLTGKDMGDLVEKGTSSIDKYIQENLDGDSAIGTLFKRISGNTKQILNGGNFLVPEIWSDSDYNKSYSFSITLSTPYGCPESWYINIGVPLMHILGLCLPQQLTANTYKSPYLVKCYSKGWFNCNYGIIDSISIEKGSDNSWSVGGLPNEVKVSLSVKDLYSTLSIPVKPYEDPATFLTTGMLEFLMVNCGIDITHQDMSEKLEVWSTILSSNFDDRFTSKPYQVQNYFKGKIQHLFNILN